MTIHFTRFIFGFYFDRELFAVLLPPTQVGGGDVLARVCFLGRIAVLARRGQLLA